MRRCNREELMPAELFDRRMTENFTIAPERSFRAYEEFILPGGEIACTIHYTFGYVAAGKTSSSMEDALYYALWCQLQKAWPPGTFLIWRRYPEIEEFNDLDPGWFERGQKGPTPGAPDNWKTKITARIGSFVPPAMGHISAGCLFPTIES